MPPEQSLSLPWRARQAMAWRASTVHVQVFSAFTVVVAASVGARAVAVGRDLAVAYRFGAGDLVDAFLIAYLVPYTLLTVLGGALHGAFLPVFVRVREASGGGEAGRLLGAVTALVLAGIGLFTVALALSVDPLLALLAGGFGAEKLALTRSLVLLLLPVALLGTLSMLWSAALNAGRRFALPAAAPALPPLAVIVAALGFGASRGIGAVALGLVVGHAAEAVVVGAGLRRRGVPLAPRWSAVTPESRAVLAQFLPLVGATALMSATVFVDQGMAARLGAGSVAALGYGGKLTGLLVGVVALALATAVFPHFAELVASRRRAELRSLLRTYSRLTLWAALAPMAVLVLASEPLAALLFERGAFTARDTALVGRVQALYLLQLPFYLTGILGARLLVAAGQIGAVMTIAAASLVTNVVGNLVFMRWWGVAGIAFSTSVVYALSCVLIFQALKRWFARGQGG